MAGHGPGSSPATWKWNDGSAALAARVSRMARLTCDGIPKSCSNVEIIGATGVALIPCINSAKCLEGKMDVWRERGPAGAKAGAEFGEVGPVLALHVGIHVY